KGDADGNTVTLDQTGLGANQVRVTGGPTTIGGDPGPVVFDDVTSGLQIDLGAGDDTIDITSSTIGENATIKAGAGANAITFVTTNVGDNLTVVTGNGNYLIDTSGANVGASTTIKNGKGNDTVTQ